MPQGRHRSVAKELKQVIAWIEKQGAKVTMGMSQCVRHKFPPGHVKLNREVDAGFRATGYSGNGVQKFMIYCDDELLREIIKARFGDD